GSRNARSCSPARDTASHRPATSKYPSPAAKQNCVKDFVPEVTNRRKPSPANAAHTRSHELANQAAAVRLSRKKEALVNEAAAISTQSRTAPPLYFSAGRIKSAPSGTTTHGPSRNSTSIIPM